MNLRSRGLADLPPSEARQPRPSNGNRKRRHRPVEDSPSRRLKRAADGWNSNGLCPSQPACPETVNDRGLQERGTASCTLRKKQHSSSSPAQKPDAGHILKRPVPEVNDAVGPPQAKKAKLTADNLRLHTAAESVKQTTKRTRSGARSGTSRTSTAYPQLGHILSENGIVYKQSRVKQPEDLEAIKAELEKSRASGSPTSEDWHLYQRRFDDATNEDSMRHFAWSKLAKEPGLGGKHYIPVIDQEWTDIETTHINHNLSNPKPDHFESLSIDCYPQAARDALQGHLQPSSYDWSMPRYAAEFQSQSGSESQAEHQAAYDGAVMVDAARAQAAHMEQPFPYGRTQALTLTSKGDMVRVFANHAVRGDPPQPQQPRFHHAQLLYGDPLASRADFGATRRRVRNAQDWARARAEETCDALCAYEEGRRGLTPAAGSQPRKRARKRG